MLRTGVTTGSGRLRATRPKPSGRTSASPIPRRQLPALQIEELQITIVSDRRRAIGLADVLPEGFGRVARSLPDPVVTPVRSMNSPDGAVRHSQELFQRADDHGTGRGRVSARPHRGIERPRHFLLQVGKPSPVSYTHLTLPTIYSV